MLIRLWSIPQCVAKKECRVERDYTNAKTAIPVGNGRRSIGACLDGWVDTGSGLGTSTAYGN